MEGTAMAVSDATKPDYGAQHIVHIEGVEAIRQNVGMYVGNSDIHGYHQIASEVIDNGIDETLAGFATKVVVIIYPDNSICIEDDGRGIPAEIQQQYGISALEIALTKIHAGAKFQKKAYNISGGLHGVGLKATCALSSWLEATIKRDGKIYFQKYLEGKAIRPVEIIGETTEHGTKILFKPSPKIFKHVNGFERDWFTKRLRDLSYLNPGIQIFLQDLRSEPKFEHKYFQKGGLKDYAQALLTDAAILKEPIFISILEKDGIVKEDGSQDEMRVEAAFTFENSDNEISLCFTNNIFNRDGGTHLTGFQTAITSCFNNYLKDHSEMLSKAEQKELGGKAALRGEDYRQGLISVISVRLARPSFQSQTKDRLTNVEIQHTVRKVIQAALDKWIEENPAAAKKIVEKAILNFRAHIASKKAAETIKKDSKSLLTGDRKLKDCTDDDPEKIELFIVEGDSAGGSAVNGRDPSYQAVLALGGKILNTWKATAAKMLSHDEISSLIRSLGTGILDSFDSAKCRYNKIIIMCDADVDGLHIRTLLLTFFFQRMRKLVEEGKVYIAQPPLYRVQHLYNDIKCAICEGNTKRKTSCGVCTGSGRWTEYITYDSDFYDRMTNLALQDAVLTGTAEKFYSQDLLEKLLPLCKDKDIKNIQEHGFNVTDIKQSELRLGEIAPTKFILRNSTKAKPVELSHLLDLPRALIELGQHCVEITRFKGLGEMGYQEIWLTTMDPKTRSLLQITIDDVVDANNKFEILMGAKAEIRRDYISSKKAY